MAWEKRRVTFYSTCYTKSGKNTLQRGTTNENSHMRVRADTENFDMRRVHRRGVHLSRLPTLVTTASIMTHFGVRANDIWYTHRLMLNKGEYKIK